MYHPLFIIQSFINKYKEAPSYTKIWHITEEIDFECRFKNIHDYDSLAKGKELQLSLFFGNSFIETHWTLSLCQSLSVPLLSEMYPATGVTLFSAETLCYERYICCLFSIHFKLAQHSSIYRTWVHLGAQGPRLTWIVHGDVSGKLWCYWTEFWVGGWSDIISLMLWPWNHFSAWRALHRGVT